MHFVHILLRERFQMVACGMVCHSCCNAAVKPATVVGWFGIWFILSPKVTHKFSMGLRSGDLAGQSITWIYAVFKNAVQTHAVWGEHCLVETFQHHFIICCHKGMHTWSKNLITNRLLWDCPGWQQDQYDNVQRSLPKLLLKCHIHTHLSHLCMHQPSVHLVTATHVTSVDFLQ